jgi:hypothetical protein
VLWRTGEYFVQNPPLPGKNPSAAVKASTVARLSAQTESGPKPAVFDCNRHLQVSPAMAESHVHSAHAAARRAMCMLFVFRRLSDHDLGREQ